MKLDFVVVSWAYFRAMARKEVYATLPEEDSESRMCGRIPNAMSGTRDAAQNWEYAYSEVFEGGVKTRGKQRYVRSS